MEYKKDKRTNTFAGKKSMSENEPDGKEDRCADRALSLIMEYVRRESE